MAKRPTIGRNPLDGLVAESHLDAVLPDLVASRPPKAKAPMDPEGGKDLPALLAAREAENLALREEVDKLKKQVEALKTRLAQAEPRWVTLRRLGGEGGRF
jgi:hypothetical protein